VNHVTKLEMELYPGAWVHQRLLPSL